LPCAETEKEMAGDVERGAETEKEMAVDVEWKECIVPRHILLCVLVLMARTRYVSTMRLCLNNEM
jgi:hypothetical protein